MAEYIERDAVLDSIGLIQLHFVAHGDNKSLFDIISEAPAADVAPVRHGRWKLFRKGGWTSVYICSLCGRRECITESEFYRSEERMKKLYPYCHCGARMDLEET